MVGRFPSTMARHKKYQLGSEAEPQLEISSLIDVCFLLLIYFLVTTTIQPRERDLRMGLPMPGERPPGSVIPPMFIRVAENGDVFSGTGTGERALDDGSAMRELPLLASQLNLYSAATRSAGDEPIVQIHVDGAASQQRVVDVLNALGGEKIASVTFTDLVDAL